MTTTRAVLLDVNRVKVSVVIPVFNEKGTVATLIDRVRAVEDDIATAEIMRQRAGHGFQRSGIVGDDKQQRTALVPVGPGPSRALSGQCRPNRRKPG